MTINGNNLNVTNSTLYNHSSYLAFTKSAEDKEMQPDTSDKSVDGDVYSKEKEPSAKLYTSSGTLQGEKAKKSKSQYSAEEILDEIETYTKAGDAYVIWHSGNKHWLQGTKNGEAVGDKKYFDFDSLNTALGKNNQKKVSVVNNTVLFENNSYYKFTGKNGKEHSILSLGGALHTGLFGDDIYDKEAADYVDFWNCLNRKNPSGISTKFSNGEIRSRLADAGIQNGFFTVTVGGRTATHYLSQGKNTAAVHSKGQYDERYDRMTSGKFFKQFKVGQKVTVGGKEYVLGEDKKLDIEYGADIFDLYAQVPGSMRKA